MAPIQLHPEIERLLHEIAILREELAVRLTELYELEHCVRPTLLALYQIKLGPWELRLLETKTEAARLKRKAQLIQASLNRGESPDLIAIAASLEIEFLAWKQRLEERTAKIAEAQFRLSRGMSSADHAELKKLYRGLVKRLHPDVNPGLSPEQTELWLQVAEAYAQADVQKLKALALSAEQPGPATAALNSHEILLREHDRLREVVHRLLEQLATIGAQPPFCWRAQWEDETWLEERRRELEIEISAAQALTRDLKNHLQALAIVYGPAKQFGLN